MSLKLKKASEIKKGKQELQAKMLRKKKALLDELPPYIFIVSEGTKTEPNYIKGLADSINRKYYNFSSGKRIEVEGTGKNTKGLLQYARKRVESTFPRAEEVWLLYDKDDFPLDDFDNTQYSAQDKNDVRKYKVAWSNECIELWFLLHFQELTVNVGRERYRELLRNYCAYEKKMENIYDILKDKTEVAVKRARKQYEEYGELPPSKMCPATRMFEIVERLNEFL